MSERKIIDKIQFIALFALGNMGKEMPDFDALPDAEPIIEAAKEHLEANKDSPWLDELNAALGLLEKKEKEAACASKN